MKRTRKPSQRVLDILNGVGTSSHRSKDPVIPPGVQLPTPIENVELEGEGVAEQMMLAMEEELDEAAEFAMAMNEVIRQAEALEPSSLAEAKRRPDWPQWEQGIREELATLKPQEPGNLLTYLRVPTL